MSFIIFGPNKSAGNILIISVLLVTAVTFVICLSALTKTSAGADATGITVVLDAGHGGIDGGVVGVKTGVKESELNLKIVKKLENYLREGGINSVLTRKTEAGLYGVAVKNLKRRDMEKRKEIILKARPALVVSVHLNKFSVSSRRGAQVFYKAGDENSHLLAESIQSVFNHACILFYVVKMPIYIVLTHDKATIFYIFKVISRKILFPVKRDIAALNNKILFVFNRCLDNLAYDGP